MGGGRSRARRPSCTTGRKLLPVSRTRFLSLIGEYANESPTRADKGKSSSKRAIGGPASAPRSPGTSRASRRVSLAGRQRRRGVSSSLPRSGRRPGAPQARPRPAPRPDPCGPGLRAPRRCRFRRCLLQARWSAGSPPLAPGHRGVARSRVLRGAPVAPGTAAGFVPGDPTARSPCFWRRRRRHCSGGSPAGPPACSRALAMHQRGRRASSGRPGPRAAGCRRVLLR
nr:uncharacterized protein C10orf95-like [Desmodus rotundus]